MSEMAAAVANPLVLWVISAETVPTAPAVVSSVALIISELEPGAGLLWLGWSAGAASAAVEQSKLRPKASLRDDAMMFSAK